MCISLCCLFACSDEVLTAWSSSRVGRLRSSNICHYFFESFHPFYAQLDAAVGRSLPRAPYARLEASAARSGRVTILMDSHVDPVKWSHNAEWWDARWPVGRGAEEGVPTFDSTEYGREWPSLNLSRTNALSWSWARGLFYCAAVHRSPETGSADTARLDVVAQNRSVAYSITELHVAAQVKGKMVGDGHRLLFQRLREQLHSCVGASGVGSEVLLYSRADTSRRRWNQANLATVNAAIARRLEQRSRRLVVRTLESMPSGFGAQMRLFANASALVMPHGAASTNAIALPAGAVFIEICPAGFSWISEHGLDNALFSGRYVRHSVEAGKAIARSSAFGNASAAVAVEWAMANNYNNYNNYNRLHPPLVKVDARYTDVLARVVVDYGDTHESHYFAHSTSIAEDVLKRIFRRGALPLDERGHEGMVQ